MDLALDETQESIVGTFADLLARECPTTHVRESEDMGFSEKLWRHYVELGACAMGLSEEHGGLGLGLLELGLVAMASGRALAPVPFIEVAVAGRLLAALDVDAALVQSLAEGEALAALVLRRDHAVAGSSRLGAGQYIVPFGSVVDHLVYLADGDVAIASRESAEVSPRLEDVGAGAHAVWEIPRGRSATIAAGGGARVLYERAELEWKLLAGFWLVGMAREAVEIGGRYALERSQFGNPIGAFQAVAHPLADAATRVDGAELLAYEAAWAFDAEPSRFPALASMAYAWASQTAQIATGASLHTHGGYGVSVEYDIQLFYRRARSLSQVAGSAREELQSVADRCFSSDPSAGQR
jgi:alkylation response protein AidB-like acyl-CoA dehydrogenase